jgi:hypothetical protein
VLVVGDTLSVSVRRANVSQTTAAKVYEATFWSRDVGVVVVDVDRQGLALVHNLHTLFPGVRIVAVTTNPGTVAEARRYGAAAAGRSRSLSAAVSALLGR